MVLFRHNLPQPTQAQLMRGEFPETLCIEQGVVLSFRFAERKVRRAPGVLRMAVVSQSSVKFGKKRVLLVGATNFIIIIIITVFVSFPQTSQYFMTWGSPRASLYVKCVGYSEGCVPPACVDSQEV